MKKLLMIAIMAVFAISADTTGEHSNLKIGDKAPGADIKMKDTSGNMQTLSAMNGEKGLLVVFSCNTCPFVVGNGTKSEGWENRYNDIYTLAENNGIGMVLVNSNEAKRDAGDSWKDNVKNAKEKEYLMTYVEDVDHKLADAFGAKRTPHVFLFDTDMKLTYQGAIDDNVNRSKEVKENYLQNALNAQGMGKSIKVKETPPVGCSIKRVKA